MTEGARTTRRILGPFNRVEGELSVKLDIQDGHIADAWITSPLYRGFEQILRGKAPEDAIAIAPRICGICSVAQSAASAAALRDAAGIDMPESGRHAINLMLATENLADHFTHFYHFFMPDFARPVYSVKHWHGSVVHRFQALKGEHAKKALQARANWFHMLGVLAGKWPHTLAIQPGGSTRPIDKSEKIGLLNTLYSFRETLEQTVFGDSLEAITELDTMADLEAWRHREPWQQSDLRTFLHIADDLQLAELGVSRARLLSYGAYARADKGHHFRSGITGAGSQEVDTRQIYEDASHAWLVHDVARHPSIGSTVPENDLREPAYSWSKAPRYQRQVCETGALARQVADGHPLARDLYTHTGSNVATRVIFRLWELARVVLMMEDWIRALTPGKPFCHSAPIPAGNELLYGAGLIEAARGSLGHWLTIRKGQIENYQIVAPTTWNFSPRDEQGTPGALEQALIGTSVNPADDNPVQAQHIVRSYDPCMSCTVH